MWFTSLVSGAQFVASSVHIVSLHSPLLSAVAHVLQMVQPTSLLSPRVHICTQFFPSCKELQATKPALHVAVTLLVFSKPVNVCVVCMCKTIIVQRCNIFQRPYANTFHQASKNEVKHIETEIKVLF